MKKFDNALVPLLGISIIFLAMYKDLMGTGSPGFGIPQIFFLVAGVITTVSGLIFKIAPISYCKNSFFENRKQLIYTLVFAVVLFLIADLLLGLFFPKTHHPHTKYGWDVPSNREVVSTVEDIKNNYREVTNKYYLHGFKRWPDKNNKNHRVLIVGDSFTQMVQVSNGEEWYAYIEREFPDIAFYVFGGGGYGTLQEYMILDDHVDKINPDAIIWQFCSNDYSNNYYELDKRAYPYNNHYVRPYLENNNVVYRLPLIFPNLRKLSFTADTLLHLYDKEKKREISKNLDKYPKDRKEKENSLNNDDKKVIELHKRKSVDVTKTLARMIRARVGSIPIYFFNACGEFTKDDKSVCKAGNFQCIEFIADYMKQKENVGIHVKVENDGHWNYLGNKIAGEKMIEYFNINGGIIDEK